MLTLKGRSGLALVSLLALGLVGCGGNGGHSSSNSAALRMSMAWPEPSRMVPNAANSVVAIVTVKGKEVARALFVRPGNARSMGDGGSTTVLLERLPAGEATVSFAAYPKADGSGVAQATGSSTEILVKGQVTEEKATMASTVSRFVLTPSPLSVAKDATASLAIEARDASNAVVLLDTRYQESLQWSSDASATATVDEDGLVKGLAAGTANVTVSMVVNDAGSKVSASAPVTVTVPRTLTSISMVPGSDFNVATHDDIQLHVYAHYSDNTQEEVTSQVTWSVYGGATAVTSTGLLKWTPGTTTNYIELEGDYQGMSTGYLDISYGS